MMAKELKRYRRKNLLLAVIFIASYLFLVVPYLFNAVASISQNTKIRALAEAENGMTPEEKQAVLKECNAYNETVAARQREIPFQYTGSGASDDVYDRLPVPGDMCVLDYPSVDIRLPVGHGTKDEVLNYEAGHLYGTSLPVGGPSVHSVFAAHTALRNALLFTNLEQAKKGDVFYVSVLDEVHAYKVTDIVKCLPDEADAHLQVQTGKDLVTLYTCTPYGVNTHRLLVTGERTTDPLIEKTKDEILDFDEWSPYKKLLLYLVPVFVIIFLFILRYRLQKRSLQK